MTDSSPKDSTPTTPNDTKPQSETALSLSVDYMEAPNLLQRPKPLIEMSDAELAAWNTLLRNHVASPQTLGAHLRSPGRVEGRTSKPAKDISRYV